MADYQNIIFNGKKYGKKKWAKSQYYNENKWRNFIEPMLPEDCSDMTLIDFGCNYGMFLKLAKKKGFKKVLGIEKDPSVAKIAREYSGEDVINIHIHKQIIDDNFLNNLIASDYILMSNFHYHVHIPVFLHLMNILRRKTRHVIFVSVDNSRSRVFFAKPDLASIRRYLSCWNETGLIKPPIIKDDQHPRDMFSVLFKTQIERVQLNKVRIGKHGRKLYKRILSNHKGTYNPITHPVILRQDGILMDGHHRFVDAKLKGEKSILAERV